MSVASKSIHFLSPWILKNGIEMRELGTYMYVTSKPIDRVRAPNFVKHSKYNVYLDGSTKNHD